MKSAAAWNVKGVGIDARETAREAARRAGLSVGEWLNSVIIDSAGDAPYGGYAEDRDAQSVSAIRQQLAALSTRLGTMGTPYGAGPSGAGLSGARERGRLGGLENRLADVTRDFARRGDESPQRFADAIRKLNNRLDDLIGGGDTRRAAFAERQDPTAAAVSEIRSRQRTLDTGRSAKRIDTETAFDAPPSGARMAELDQHLRALTRQLETMNRPCAFDDSVAALRSDLGRIGDALAKAMPRCALDALESEVESLVDRAGRHSGADTAPLASIEQRLGQIHDALAGLTPAENIGGFEAAVEALSRKIDVLAANGPDAPALRHLETAIAELHRITERVASGDALATLADEVRMLAERMNRFAEPESNTALASIERRIEALHDLMSARAAEPENRNDLASLERRLDSLSDLMNRAPPARTPPCLRVDRAAHRQAQRSDEYARGRGRSAEPRGGHDRRAVPAAAAARSRRDNRAALHHIEAQIAQLGEKIDTSEARFGHVEVIERGLTDLFHRSRTSAPTWATRPRSSAISPTFA